MRRFTLTEEHLKLLRAMFVTWWHCETGAPAIDPKRPYGNSDVTGDIAEIIGIVPIETDDDPAWPVGTSERCEKLHEETQTALQVVLATGRFRIGEYVADDFRRNWREE